MTLRQYLTLMTFGTLLAWAAVALVVLTVDPNMRQAGVLIAFYAATFLALVGTFSIAGLLMRIGMLRHQLVVSRHVAVAFRQAVLLAALVIAALFLKSRGQLSLGAGIMLLGGLTMAEFVLISLRVRGERRPPAPARQ